MGMAQNQAFGTEFGTKSDIMHGCMSKFVYWPHFTEDARIEPS